MKNTQSGSKTVIENLEVSAYTIPTDAPEADGTFSWSNTTLVLVKAKSAVRTGLGYTYADTATAQLIHDMLRQVVVSQDAMAVPAIWSTMVRAIRNLGRPGIASMAIAAVDVALWDLKARLLDIPLVYLVGQVHEGVPVYGSGGFTSYSIQDLQEQLHGWSQAGIPRVKMKVGTEPDADCARVKAAREAIGPGVELFVDANGAYSRKQALRLAEHYAELGVCWFEEPVSADDLDGLRLVRDRCPVEMEIAAGEYGYELRYFQRMLQAGAVDVLQADASRCAGITGFLQAAAICQAYGLELSAHCAILACPSLLRDTAASPSRVFSRPRSH